MASGSWPGARTPPSFRTIDGVTERKPPGIGFESWVDKQIREATDRGEFDNLPGTGKPIPGYGRPDDELWWVKDYVRREGLTTEDLLPTPLRLRKEIEQLPETVARLRSERAVRDAVDELNRRITDWLRVPSGPQISVLPVDVDDVVRQWHAARQAAARPGAAPPTTARPGAAPPTGARPDAGTSTSPRPDAGSPASPRPDAGRSNVGPPDAPSPEAGQAARGLVRRRSWWRRRQDAD